MEQLAEPADSGAGRRLVVYAPDVMGVTDRWLAVVERLESDSAFADSSFHVWPEEGARRPLRPWRRRGLDSYVIQLEAFIGSLIRESERNGNPFVRVTLVGASVGGLLVRDAWLRGLEHGDPANGLWASRVDRLVLAASINRGFDPRRLGLLRLVLSLLSPFRMMYRDALVGSSFVTNLRVRWIRTMSQLQQPPHVVQLLGDEDGIVTRDDSLDVEQFANAAHITLVGVRHANVLEISGPGGERRFMDIRDALLGATPASTPPPAEGDLASDVVLALHGIRAGVWGWVSDISAQINALPEWKAIRPSYGFFSALEFALPPLRARKVRWFLDRYTKELARNPGARFHFVGHSNGTYSLGYGLKQIRGMRFERVYVAGSVLPVDFPWTTFRDSGQLDQIRSDRGNKDFAVALLAQGLRGLGMRDVGSGGFNGFLALDDSSWSTQWPFFPGGHGEPLKKSRREGVVAWVTGSNPAKPADLVDSSGGIIAALSRVAPVALTGLVLLLLAAIVIPLILEGWTPVAVSAVAFTAVALVLGATL